MTDRPTPVLDAGARWQLVKRVLDAVLACPPPDRPALLDVHCAADAALRAEVEALLATDTDGFLVQSPVTRLAESAGRLPVAPTIDEVAAHPLRLQAWRVVRVLGHGGMGTVYLGERDDGAYEQRAAIKVMRATTDSTWVERRLRRERQILAELDHPNVARLMDGGSTDDGRPYLLMEYVDGEPIDVYCRRRNLSLSARLALVQAVCSAVHYAHQRLVVHRDIKPSNVLVTSDGVIKLLDFGIAHVLAAQEAESRTTLQAMTPAYASPEQRARRAVTTLTDVWAVGVLLYELLTGVHPEIDTVPVPPSQRIPARAPYDARSVRGDLDKIVLMAMRPEPERRYGSAAALADDLQRHLTGLPVIARGDSAAYRVGRYVRRHRASVAAGVLVVASLATGFVMASRAAHVARQAQVRAERRFAEVRALATDVLFEVDSQIAGVPGTTPAREALVRHALQALDGLARDVADAVGEAGANREDALLLRQLATAYARVADVQGKPYAPNLGHTQAALENYRKAVAIIARLRAVAPRDLSLMQEHARLLQLGSAVQARAGDVDGGIATARHAAALYDSARVVMPADTALRARLASSVIWLGRSLYQKQSLPAVQEALRWYGEALAINEALAADAPRDPSRRYAAAVNMSYQAYGLWSLGDLTGDTAYYRNALQRLEQSHQLVRSIGPALPSPVESRRASVDALHEMATLHVRLGEPREALRLLREAYPVTTTLALADPYNAEAQRDLAALEGSLADAYIGMGASRQGAAAAQRAIAIVTHLRASDTSSVEDLQSLSALNASLAAAHRAGGDLVGALARYETARELAARWSQAAPSSDGARRLLAHHEASLAALLSTAHLERASVSAPRRCALLQDAQRQWAAIAVHAPLAPADSAAAAATRDATCGSPTRPAPR